MKFNDIKQKNENKIKEIEKQMEEAEDKNILNTKLEIHRKIQELLEKDEAIFFNIQMDESMKILSYIIDEKDIEETYRELTSAEVFKDLKNRFKI